MKTLPQVVRLLECGLLLCGSLLLALFVFGHVHRFIMLRVEMASFEAKQLEVTKKSGAKVEATHTTNSEDALDSKHEPEQALWSAQRIQSHESVLGQAIDPLAVLRIPKLGLEVPVLDGTTGFILNRGVGRIAGTARPGQDGNIGIAGHRDGFFRNLKELKTGDTLELVTASGTDVYLVDQIRITRPADVSVLQARRKRSVTLVTCYPFYFVGPAPDRYVVAASLKQ
jgi:sortase A